MTAPEEWELTPQQQAEYDEAYRQYDNERRLRALRACWLPKVVSPEWRKGPIFYRDARDDEWTLWRAIKLTVAIVLDRGWGDEHQDRWRGKGREYHFGWPMAYFDSLSVYGGYDITRVELYPGCRYSIFNDGETNL